MAHHHDLVPHTPPSFIFEQVVYHTPSEFAHAVFSNYPRSDRASVVKRYQTAADNARRNADGWATKAKDDPKYEDYARMMEQTAASMESQVKALAQHAPRASPRGASPRASPRGASPRAAGHGGSRRRNKKSKNSKNMSNKSHRRK
jgi:hypothetical protein